MEERISRGAQRGLAPELMFGIPYTVPRKGLFVVRKTRKKVLEMIAVFGRQELGDMEITANGGFRS
jgi:hypothetical protein